MARHGALRRKVSTDLIGDWIRSLVLGRVGLMKGNCMASL